MMLLLAITLNKKLKERRKKKLWIKEYLNMIRPYLSNKMNDHKNQGE